MTCVDWVEIGKAALVVIGFLLMLLWASVSSNP